MIKAAIATLAVSIVSVTVANFFFSDTQAASPESSLPQTFDNSMLLLETRTSDFSSSVFNVMTPGDVTKIIYKTQDSFPVSEKPKAIWGLTNYDFFIKNKDGKTICYVFNVSDWEVGAEIRAEKDAVGYSAYLVDAQTGETKEYDWKNIPDEFLAKIVEYTASLETVSSTAQAASEAATVK